MANCAPCLKLGLQIVAHYSADLSAGKEAECYYHHFGMPLPKSVQDKIAQPKVAQQPPTPAEDATPAAAEGKPHAGTASMNRGKLHPDVCAECWRNGHSCRAHCTVENERLCLDCADGLPCAYVREKEASPKPAVHERYHVTIPGRRREPAEKPANVTAPKTLPIPPQPKRTNMSLVMDGKDLPTRAVSAPVKPSAVEKEISRRTAAVADIHVSIAGNDRQKEEERTNMATKTKRLCACGCGTPLVNRHPFIKGHNPDAKKSANGAAPAPSSKATPPRNSSSKIEAPESGAATLHVTETHLNNFLLKLSLDEKTAIVQRHLEGV